jgi:hypothetical protein
MKKLTSILLLALALTSQAAQTSTLSWVRPTNANYTVQIYRSTDLFAPKATWPLYLTTNNPVGNSIIVQTTGKQAYFSGTYYVIKTNFTSASSITLGWDYPSGISNNNIWTFLVYRTPTSGFYGSNATVAVAGLSTNYTWMTSNLPTVTNFFVTTARNANNLESPPSNEAKYVKVSSPSSYTTNFFGLVLTLKR